jgi:hypothetical protein
MKNTVYSLVLLVLFSYQLFGQEYESYKKLLDTTITSTHLGFEKNITITVPFEWQQNLNRDFPVIVIFDRQNQRSHNYIINTIDYLTSNDQMPSSIIISVESEQKYRYLETLYKATDKKGLAEENEKFIFEEILPLAEKHYNASAFRLFIGHSRYGYFTSSLFISRINELNAVISLSPFFLQTNVDLTDSIQAIEQQELNSLKYYRFGVGNDFPDDFLIMDSVVTQLNHSNLNAKGFLFPEADHNVTPGLTIGISLYELFEDWAKIQSKYITNDQKDLKILPSLEKEIMARYGSPLAFGLGILNGKGWYFYNEKEYAKAIEAWGILMKSYPNFSEGYLYIMDAQIQLKQDISETIELFNESLAKSDIYSETERNELIAEMEGLKK